MEPRHRPRLAICSKTRCTQGARRVVRDLNQVYRAPRHCTVSTATPTGSSGSTSPMQRKAWSRICAAAANPHEFAVVVCNFTPVAREDYWIGVPRPGRYRERINTDAADYGGSGVGNAGEVHYRASADARPSARDTPAAAAARRPDLYCGLNREGLFNACEFMRGAALPFRFSRPASALSRRWRHEQGLARQAISPRAPTWDGKGVNFALFSAHAEKVELCLFDRSGLREEARVRLPEYTDEVWHAYLPDARPDLLYGYRVYGPYDPPAGTGSTPTS